MKNLKNKRGRPTKYKPEYCKAIIDFFTFEPYREVPVITTYKDGTTKEDSKEVANDVKFISQFADSIGVHDNTLELWCKKYPEFLCAYNRSKEMMSHHCAVNAMRGNFEGYFTVFFMKNVFNWRDKQDHEVGGKDGEPIVIKMVNYANS